MVAAMVEEVRAAAMVAPTVVTATESFAHQRLHDGLEVRLSKAADPAQLEARLRIWLRSGR